MWLWFFLQYIWNFRKITCLLPSRELIRADVCRVSTGHGEQGLFVPVYLCSPQVVCSSSGCRPTLRNVICDCISCHTHSSKLLGSWQPYWSDWIWLNPALISTHSLFLQVRILHLRLVLIRLKLNIHVPQIRIWQTWMVWEIKPFSNSPR